MKYELSHDVLALKAYQRASADDKALRKVERLIKERYAFYKQRRILLSKDDLDYIKPYLDQVAISAEEEAFIARSNRAIKRKRRIFTALILAVFLALSGLTAFALIQSRNAQKEKERAIEASRLATENAQIAQEKELEAQKEKNRALEAQELADKNALLAMEREKDAERERDNALRAQTEANNNARIAQENEQKAQKEKDNAIQARVEADLNADLAKQNETRADSLRILSLAQSLMAIAAQVENPILKAKLANQAYIFHVQQNGNPYDPVIHDGLRSALVAANWANTVNKHRSAIMGMAFSADGQNLFSTARDGKLIKWNWNGKLDSVNASILKNPMITQGGLSINKEWIAVSGNQTSQLEIFKLADFPNSFSEQVIINQPINDLLFHPKHPHQVILATANGLIYKDIEAARANSSTFAFPKVPIQTLAVDGSGDWIAGINQSGKIEIGPTDQQATTLNFKDIENAQSIAFSQRKRFFAVGDRNGKVWLYDFESGERLTSLGGHTARVSQVSFYEKNEFTFLVSVGYDGKAQLWYWDSQENEKIKEQLSTRLPIVLKADEKWEFRLTFSPDGKYILIGNRNGGIQQWLIHIDDMATLLRQQIPDLKLSEDEWKQYLKEEAFPN